MGGLNGYLRSNRLGRLTMAGSSLSTVVVSQSYFRYVIELLTVIGTAQNHCYN